MEGAPPLDSSATDSGAGPDAATSASCGGGYCRGQEVCVSSACVFQGCVGAQVPADFATVNAAVTSLAATGGTVCVAAGDYEGDVEIDDTVDVTILGVSAAQVTLGSVGITFQGRPSPPAHFQTISLQGVSIKGDVQIGLTSDYAVVNLTDCGMAGGVSSSQAGGLSVTASGGQLSVNVTASRFVSVDCTDGTSTLSTGEVALTVDGADLGASGYDAFFVETWSPSSHYILQNSYLHDSGIGAEFASQLSSPTASFTVVNNTFVGNQDGLYLSDEDLTVTLFNNILVGSMLAYESSVSVPAASSGDNAYFDDTTNYEGQADAGTGDVTANPLLDTSTPPGLKVGSPCRGTGNASQAPSTDYWGRPRPSDVDIGAVQSSP